MPTESTQDKLSRFTLILNSFVFIISAYLFFTAGNILYAGIIFFTGLFYLVSLRLMSVSKTITELGLYILNMMVALITTIDFFRRGTHYIQYVWTGVTVVYLVFSIRQFYIWRRPPHKTDPGTDIMKNTH